MIGSMLGRFGASFVAGILLVVAGSASAFEITQAIPSTNQTACLDVEGDKTADGTPIQAYPCTGGFNEQWSLDKQGHLQGIGTESGDADCLEAKSNKKVVLNSCKQTWLVGSNLPNGGYISMSGSDCLDSQGVYRSGAQVIDDTCMGLASQIWVLKDIVIEQPIPKTDESACVDTRGNAIADHTPVDAYPCNLGVNERWTYVNGDLQGVTTKGVTTCLGKAATTNQVELQTCATEDTLNQFWFIMAGQVINYFTNLCLDSQGKHNNVQLVLNPCSGAPSQIWILR
jgi:hypothetical protein